MQDDIAKVLIDRKAIAARVESLAAQIAGDVTREAGEPGGDGTEITLVPILVGSVIFLADLIRHLPMRMQIRVMTVASYPGTATSSQGAKVNATLTTLPERLDGRHVLVVDDILDSGNTLRLVTDVIRQRNPVSVRTCVLLRKQRPEAMGFPVDYVAFDIPDEFVVGYGLDYDDYYRNLPDIVTLRPEVVGLASQVPSPKSAER